jgi:hypothetical protein
VANERVGRAILEMASDTAALLRGVDQIEGRMKGAASMISTLGKSIAGAFSVAAIGAAIRSYSDLTGQLTDLSAKTGIGVEALQRLKFAAEQNGGTLEQVTGAVTKLGANLAGGNKSAVGALDALGFSVDKIRNMQPDQAFTAIADAIAKVPDPMDRSKLAMDLFGKSGAELLPMMRGNLSETAAEAERLGLVMSEDAVAAGDEFGDTMDKLMLVGQALIGQVLEPMIPAITAVAGWLGDMLPAALDGARSGFDFLVRKGLEVELWLREMVLRIVELGNKVPWLGEKLGASTENVQALRESVQHAKDTLSAYNRQTEETGKRQEATSKTVARLNLDYDAQEKAVDKAAKATERLAKEQAKFAASVSNLPISSAWWVPYHAGVEMVESDVGRLIELETRAIGETAQLTAEAEEWARVNGAVLAPSIKAVSTVIEEEVPGWGDTFRTTFEGLPNIIMGAIQGGGNVLGAVGAHIGTSLMSRFQTTFGPAIEDALPFGIGRAVTALIPLLGSLFGPVLSKIGGFFRNLFGGPSAEELAGREIVAKFEANVQSLLTQRQRLEAGNDSWRQTVVAVRDAYLAVGRTEAEALAAVENLWRSSKGGAEAVEAAMQPIQEVLDEVARQSDETGLSVDELRDRAIEAGAEATGSMEAAEQTVRDLGVAGEEVSRALMDSIGSLNFQIPVGFNVERPDFGDLPVVPMAEGGMGHVTSPTLFLAGEAGGEDFAFSGGGRRFGGGPSVDVSLLQSEIQGLRRDLTTIMPTLVEQAARHGAQTAGRRR